MFRSRAPNGPVWVDRKRREASELRHYNGQRFRGLFISFQRLRGVRKPHTALENAAQREEIITIEYGGARYPKAVECSPQRRIDIALRQMTQGAYQKSFNSKKSIENCLAEEIINAYRLSSASNAIAKKFEVERQADSSR